MLRTSCASLPLNPRDEASWTSVGWPKSPRALAGRLRRAQTPLRALGIEITFSREGRAGTRIIRMRKSRPEATAATVSTVSADSAQKTVDLRVRRTSRIPGLARSRVRHGADGADDLDFDGGPDVQALSLGPNRSRAAIYRAPNAEARTSRRRMSPPW